LPRFERNVVSKLETIRTVIADDHTVVREGLVAILRRMPEVTVIGQEQSWPDAIAAIGRHNPDVALLDVRMPGMTAAEAVSILRRTNPKLRIVLMSAFECDEDIYGVIRAGANGFIVKSCSPQEIFACLRGVVRGKQWLPAASMDKLQERQQTKELTPRQLEILDMVTDGKSNKEVGSALRITEGTVKVQMNQIFRKLGATNRTEAINKGLQRGLVQWRKQA
jgi:two-component system NarL family response regulator